MPKKKSQPKKSSEDEKFAYIAAQLKAHAQNGQVDLSDPHALLTLISDVIFEAIK
jgi:hypothetical protein